MHSEPRLSIVIPVYRSERVLATTVRELVAALDWTTFEIVLVNDASPDRVQDVIDQLCSDPRIRSLTLGANVGQHRATLLGIAETRGAVVVTIDDDGQNPPSAVRAVLDTLGRGNLDVVYGRFDVRAQSIGRRLASAVNLFVSRFTLPNPNGLSVSNVRAVRGDLARHVSGRLRPYPYIDALLFRASSRIGEVTVEHRPRTAGTSTYTLRTLAGFWLSHLTSLSIWPLRLAVFGSFGISVIGFLVGAAATVRALALGGAPTGWLSLFCAVTFLFSVLFAFLGIVSAYVGRLYVSSNEQGLVWVRSRSVARRSTEPGVPPAGSVEL